MSERCFLKSFHSDTVKVHLPPINTTAPIRQAEYDGPSARYRKYIIKAKSQMDLSIEQNEASISFRAWQFHRPMAVGVHFGPADKNGFREMLRPERPVGATVHFHNIKRNVAIAYARTCHSEAH